MQNMSRLFIAMALLALGGCHLWPFHRQAQELKLDVEARASLNPDEAGRAYPVVVRVYQLKKRDAFDLASYEDLIDRDRDTLAADLIDRHDAVVRPGANLSITQPLKGDARYIGIAAFFRSPTNAEPWRMTMATAELPKKRPVSIVLVDRGLASGTAAK